MCNRKGQTILEFMLIIIIFLGVMITMKDDIKRHIQGRWHSAADDFGDQYDPQHVNSMTNYSTLINSDTVVQVINGSALIGSAMENGQWTNRVDTSNTLETTTGFTQVGN